MEKKYHELINQLQPFLIANPDNTSNFNKELFGKEIKDEFIFNPLLTSSEKFIELIYRMDKLTFGDQGMGMDKWVFFDCSVMPGFVFGFAIDTELLCEKDKDFLGITDEKYFPVSMYIAIPTVKYDVWFGHNLSSLNGLLNYSLSGLGLLTKVAALKMANIIKLMGATQWDSKALYIHSRISDLELLSAFTPIHSKKNTLCYLSKVSNAENALVIPKNSVEYNFTANLENIKKLQCDIENGKQVKIVGTPQLNKDESRFCLQDF